MSKQFTATEIAKHKTAETGMHIIIDNEVYDVTQFIDEHPGGKRILQRVLGKDASKQFWKYHGESTMKKYGDKLKIGVVVPEAKL